MSRRIKITFIALILISFFTKCTKNDTQEIQEKLYTLIDSSASGLDFTNTLTESEHLNYFTYPYMYFGAGVGVGDLDNDGLDDVVTIGNMVPSKVYKNLGELKFQDVSRESNFDTGESWVTGVNIVDINNDGLLDIYLCVSGKDITDGKNPFFSRENLLFENQGEFKFKEKSEQYGLNDNSMSVQSAFFDFDKDGDLDMYLANYPEAKLNSTNDFWRQKVDNPNMEESDKFYRNDDGVFVDITKDAGITNYGLGLGIVISDLNNDGWDDVYVSNDFNTPDYAYLNQQDGTFKDGLKDMTNQTANYGMGIDIADFNNDGYMDIFQLDMMPEFNYDKKINMGPMNHQEFKKAVEVGFHYQYMHNVLQLNNGDGTYSQISKMAEVAETDWSWSALFLDMNNDGFKDLFITNGLWRSVNNNDFNQYLYESTLRRDVSNENIMSFLEMIPQEPKVNYAYQNTGGLIFENTSKKFGLDFSGYSNGASYADLDKDGDLEIIVNNINDPIHIYENNLTDSHFLNVSLRGDADNFYGIGAKVICSYGDQIQVSKVQTARGFQSSIPANVHFGIPGAQSEIKLKVIWPNGLIEEFTTDKVDQYITLKQGEGMKSEMDSSDSRNQFSIQLKKVASATHIENENDDFEFQYLLPHKISNQGPGLAVGDVDGDGDDDIFMGNASGESSKLLIQSNGAFNVKSNFPSLSIKEIVDGSFVDLDADGDLDLAIAAGGNEFQAEHSAYQDLMLINDGKGNFVESQTLGNGNTAKILPINLTSEEHPNLVTIGYAKPRQYPIRDKSLLFNNSTGELREDQNLESFLEGQGIFQDGLTTDFDADGDEDLLLVGEWTGVVILENENGQFRSFDSSVSDLTGWWGSVTEINLDGDEFPDYIIGNAGLNYKYRGTEASPLKVYAKNFDDDADVDVVLAISENGKEYPVRGRRDFTDQFPELQQKFPTHEGFANATVQDIFEGKLGDALELDAKEFRSVAVLNNGAELTVVIMPEIMQTSSVNAMVVDDFNGDGKDDILFGGNLYNTEPETPRLDASYGGILYNLKLETDHITGDFKSIGIKGQINAIEPVTIDSEKWYVLGINNKSLQLIKISLAESSVQ